MKIVLTGSLAVDQIMNFDGLFEEMIQPDKLHVLSISVLVKKLRHTRGGIAGNIAYSLALLGEKPVLFASIGAEQKPYIRALAKKGVDISHVHYSQLPTATFSVITDRNDCQVGGFYPGAMSDASSLSFQKFADQEILAVISAHDPTHMQRQIDECQRLRQRLFFDVGQQVIILPKVVLEKGLAAAELLILNDYELGVLAKKLELSPDEVIRRVNTCVVTLGEKGAVIYTKEHAWQAQEISAVKVTHSIDPTGAGDAFRAGFLYGYVREWELRQSAQLGATLAAFAIEKLGTQEHRPTLAQIKKRYYTNYKSALSL